MPANTGVIDGGDLMLYAEISSVWTLVAEAKSHTLSSKAEIRVRRTKSTGLYPARKIVALDAQVNTDNLVTYGSWSYFELLALQQAKTDIKLKLAGHDDSDLGITEQIGDKYLEGTFCIESVDLNAADGDDASMTASFAINGAVGNGLEIKTVVA
jgi:hypothetical protein